MPNQSTTYRAAWVISVDQPPIEDGVITICDGIITAVGKYSHRQIPDNPIDLGEAAIIPSLVNAHTHLEFSQLKEPLGYSGIEFTDWVRAVVKYRLDMNSNSASKRAAIVQGLQETADAGAACVGEIATQPIDRADYQVPSSEFSPVHTPPVHSVVFLEQLGRSENQFVEKLAAGEDWLNLFPLGAQPAATGSISGRSDPFFQPAISPHAPYSVHPKLLTKLCELATRARVPIAMHVAETLAERELLIHQSGPFIPLLQEFGAWDCKSSRPTQSILEILKLLATTPRALIVHGNYLNDLEIEFIARHRKNMSVVYCPRTHEYFGHSPYPLKKISSANIVIAMGTDSRASNPDLNLFLDLKIVARKFPEFSPLEILRMGTLNGAVALGVDRVLGTLTPGKRAALSVIRRSKTEGKPSADWRWLFDDATICEPCRGASTG